LTSKMGGVQKFRELSAKEKEEFDTQQTSDLMVESKKFGLKVFFRSSEKVLGLGK